MFQFLPGLILEFIALKSRLYPQEVITPEENMMISFRGDACHKVESFYTATDKTRVSLVVEQYKINAEDMDFVIPLTSSIFLRHDIPLYPQKSWLRRLLFR